VYRINQKTSRIEDGRELEIPFESTDYVQKDMKDGESHDYIQNEGENTGA
jgi:hypothetical protein